MDSTFIYSRRKTIFWKVYFKSMVQPLKALSLASECEGDVIDDINTMKVPLVGRYTNETLVKVQQKYQNCYQIQAFGQKNKNV